MNLATLAFAGVITGAGALTTVPAQAGTVSYTANFGPALTDFTTDALTVAGFDTSLGTLVSVSLTLAGSVNVGLSITNHAASSATFTVSAGTVLSLINGVSTINGLAVHSDAIQQFSLAPEQSVSIGPLVQDMTATVSGSPLSAFTNGPVAFRATTLSEYRIDGDGNNLDAAINSTAAGSLTVAYTYRETVAASQPASVPEPASLALIGAGLTALGMFRRSKA